MRAIRRLGTTPRERDDTTRVSGSPDILELDDGSFAIIGVDITDELGRQPLPDARCAPDERIVRITRQTLLDARSDIPAEQMPPPAALLSGSKRLSLDEFRAEFAAAWSRLSRRFLKLECWQHYQEVEASGSHAAFDRGNIARARELLRQEAQADRPLYEDVRRKGIDYARIRLVRRPLTPYLRYEMIAYAMRGEMGENIQIVEVPATLTPLPNADYFDFLLFDNECALIHDCGTAATGKLRGGWLVRDPSAVADLENKALTLRQRARPIAEFPAAQKN